LELKFSRASLDYFHRDIMVVRKLVIILSRNHVVRPRHQMVSQNNHHHRRFHHYFIWFYHQVNRKKLVLYSF